MIFVNVRKMTTSNIRFRTSSTLFYDKCSSSVAGIVLPGISRFSEAAKFNVLGCSLKIRTRALKTEIRNFHLLFYYCVTVFVMLCFPFLQKTNMPSYPQETYFLQLSVRKTTGSLSSALDAWERPILRSLRVQNKRKHPIP